MSYLCIFLSLSWLGIGFLLRLLLLLLLLLTLVAGLLARSQYPEGPATDHLGTGISW